MPTGFFARDLGRGGGVRHDLAVDAGLAHAAGDQLRVLRAEVDDEHGALIGLGLFGHRLFSVGMAWVRDECSARECSSASSRDFR